jgi:hypothetical protein
MVFIYVNKAPIMNDAAPCSHYFFVHVNSASVQRERGPAAPLPPQCCRRHSAMACQGKMTFRQRFGERSPGANNRHVFNVLALLPQGRPGRCRAATAGSK